MTLDWRFSYRALRRQLCEAVSDADGPGVYLMPAKWPVLGLQLPLLNVIIVGFLPCVAASVRTFRIHRFKEMTSYLTYEYDCLWCFLLGLHIELVIVWLDLFPLNKRCDDWNEESKMKTRNDESVRTFTNDVPWSEMKTIKHHLNRNESIIDCFYIVC